MADIAALQAQLVVLQTTLSSVLAGTIQEYSIAGRRVVYRDPKYLYEAIQYINGQIAALSGRTVYAGFGSPE